MAGTRGPIPKRDAERRRTNKPEIPLASVVVTGPVPVPPAGKGWHPVALQLYDSLPASAQSCFYEASDWATAWLLCESLSRDLKLQVVGTTQSGRVVRAHLPLKGASLASYLKGFASLGMTEGDRRRMSIEIDRRKVKKPAVVRKLADYRDPFAG